jgi:ElaB/YqjD/DUF883 family membrane-anchored ribosome-binding protein
MRRKSRRWPPVRAPPNGRIGNKSLSLNTLATPSQENNMFGSKQTIGTASKEMHAMINEAEQMLCDATAATGEKATDLQKKGMQLLSSSISKAHELERIAISSAKDMAASADTMVHDHPWRSVAGAGLIGAGIGLVIGMALSRE